MQRDWESQRQEEISFKHLKKGHIKTEGYFKMYTELYTVLLFHLMFH